MKSKVEKHPTHFISYLGIVKTGGEASFARALRQCSSKRHTACFDTSQGWQGCDIEPYNEWKSVDGGASVSQLYIPHPGAVVGTKWIILQKHYAH